MATDEVRAGVGNAVDAGLAEAGFLEFATAGTAASGEFRCAECGYGVVVHQLLPLCPMCRGEVWEQPPAARHGLAPGERLQ